MQGGTLLKPLGPGKLKLNSDAGVFSDGSVGLGFVVQTDEGQPVLAGAKRMQVASSNSVFLEALALRFGVMVAWSQGYQIDTLETDSKSLMSSLQGRSVDASSMLIVEDIDIESRASGVRETSFVRRDANRAAHFFAHFSLSLSFECLWTDLFPASCTRLFVDDVRREPLNLV
ncbi:hypothetical protein ACS0TY_022657 [Phlomoides rotata]